VFGYWREGGEFIGDENFYHRKNSIIVCTEKARPCAAAPAAEGAGFAANQKGATAHEKELVIRQLWGKEARQRRKESIL